MVHCTIFTSKKNGLLDAYFYAPLPHFLNYISPEMFVLDVLYVYTFFILCFDSLCLFWLEAICFQNGIAVVHIVLLCIMIDVEQDSGQLFNDMTGTEGDIDS